MSVSLGCGFVPRRIGSLFILALLAFCATDFVNAVDSFALGACGDVDCSGSVSASDALAVLKKAVGSAAVVACPLNCSNGQLAGVPTDDLVVCGDFNCSASVTAADALSLLKAAVGQSISLQCGTECPGVSTTTTTTLPPIGDEEAAVQVISSVEAAPNIFGVPSDPQYPKTLQGLATFSNQLVDSNAGGTLPLSVRAGLESIAGAPGAADLTGCFEFVSGGIDFTNCNLGGGTTFGGSVGASGNTFTLDLTYTIATPFGTTTISMDGDITVTTSTITGTLTLVTATTSGANTSTVTVTEVFDVGIVPPCPNSGTVTNTWQIVEKSGQNTTRDDQSTFTTTYGPNCGDATFSQQTTTTVPVTTTTLAGQSPFAPAALDIVQNAVEVQDLATGDGLDADKLDRLSLFVDHVSVLAGLHGSGQLLTASVAGGARDHVVQPPDPGCMSRVGNRTEYTDCSIDFARFTWHGILVANGDTVAVDMHFVDQANHTRDFTGVLTVTGTSISGTIDTISNQPAGSLTTHVETSMTFDVGLEARCGRSGTLAVHYHNQSLIDGNVALEKEGDFTATYGPGCGAVAFD